MTALSQPPGGDSSLISAWLQRLWTGRARDSGSVALTGGANTDLMAGTVRRVGDQVTLTITTARVVTGTASDNGVLTIPAGYRPSAQFGVRLIESNETTKSAFVQTSGNLQCYNTVSGATYRTASPVVYYTSEPWPA